jgi:dipeptidyl aminopeptidase/acylaminoacyl peptidase
MRRSESRRRLLQALSFFAANIALPRVADIEPGNSDVRENDSVEYGRRTLPRGVRSRRVDTNNGVVLHILESGFEVPARPCVLLLHGFPELAYSWRNQLLPLARAGFHVIAPDLRGYGRSAATAVTYDDALLP